MILLSDFRKNAFSKYSVECFNEMAKKEERTPIKTETIISFPIKIALKFCLILEKEVICSVYFTKILKHSSKHDKQMLDRLQYVKQRFDEISDLIIQPDVIADQKRYVQLNQEYKGLKALMEKRDEYVRLTDNIAEANEILDDGSDAEMVEMAKMQ